MSLATLNTQAALDVLAERQRQRDVEGWTPEHDDQHARGEMIEAAISYGVHASVTVRLLARGETLERVDQQAREAMAPRTWPWSLSWWKPAGGARRNLVKAAALLLAEIERIDRKTEREASHDR